MLSYYHAIILHTFKLHDIMHHVSINHASYFVLSYIMQPSFYHTIMLHAITLHAIIFHGIMHTIQSIPELLQTLTNSIPFLIIILQAGVARWLALLPHCKKAMVSKTQRDIL